MPFDTHPHHKNHIVTKVVTFIVFVLLAVVLVLFARSIKKDTLVEEAPIVETPKVVDMSRVTEVPLVSTSEYGTVSGSYPKFSNASSAFNDKIRNNIVIAQAEFENLVKDNWQARVDTQSPGDALPKKDDMYFDVKTDYVQVNDNVISILIHVSAYTGGAHGYENLYSYNYNVTSNKEITLADFFVGNADYLKTVADFSQTELISQFTNKLHRGDFSKDAEYNEVLDTIKDMVDEGTIPTEENFSVFTHDPESLFIHFQQYQVAPYVYGTQVVKMPRAVIL